MALVTVHLAPTGYVFHRERLCAKIRHQGTLRQKRLNSALIVPGEFIHMPGKVTKGGEFYTRRRRPCQFC